MSENRVFINSHNGMSIKYAGKVGGALRQVTIEPESLNSDVSDCAEHPWVYTPGFFLRTAEDSLSLFEYMGTNDLHGDARCVSFESDAENGITAVYLSHGETLQVTVRIKPVNGAAVFSQINTVKNVSDKDISVTHISSSLVDGIALGGKSKWHENINRIKVHYAKSYWQGEAQWTESSLEAMGMHHRAAHDWTKTSFSLNSIGSWSTARYYPAVMLEDTETGSIWYLEHEGGESWSIEVGGMPVGRSTLHIECTSADEDLGFCKILAPGEEYVTSPCIFGCTNGGFEEAVRQLTSAKRATDKAPWKTEGRAPMVCFNTYMNCLWGAGNEKTLPPLINKAAEIGAEVFCLDAGWQKEPSLGTWDPNDEQFGAGGLRGICDIIREKGMIPGVWLEIESICRESRLYEISGCLIKNGIPVSNARFADFTNPKTAEYLEGVIDRLYGIGVRFIKNDYNASIRPGAEVNGSSYAEGIKLNAEAFYRFVDHISSKYTDLIIENCGSGAMRSDWGTLSCFTLQSTSDQEIYKYNPSILSGSLVEMPPEKAGIWAYPYPCALEKTGKNADPMQDEEYINQMRNGNQTVFNMVNGMCGVLYISGRIDCADEYNTGLIKEAVDFYKRIRINIPQSFPIWPTGKLHMSDKGYGSVGLLKNDGSRIYLAVWRLECANDKIEIDLSKYTGNRNFRALSVYPERAKSRISVESNSKLKFNMPDDYTAIYTEIEIQ